MVDYAEITGDEVALQKEKPATTRRTINLTDSEIANWALDFIEQTGSFIGNNSFSAVKALIKEIVDAGILVDTAYAVDYRRAIKALKKSLIDFYSRKAHQIMFSNHFSLRKKSAKDIFLDGVIKIRKREGLTINLISSHQPMSSHLQQKGIVVEGYKFSIRPYVKFDTPPEKWIADKLEYLCSLDTAKKSFWIRNEPKTEYPVEVSRAPFFPDFVAFIEGRWIVADVKGKHLAETKQIEDRKNALRLLEREGSIKTLFLVDTVMENRGFTALEITAIDDFDGFDELRHEELKFEEFPSGSPMLF